MKRLHPDSVEDDQVVAAKVRRHAVATNNIVKQNYPTIGQPAWAVAMQQSLVAEIRAVEQRMYVRLLMRSIGLW